jgi:hypothetical protein
MGKDALKSMEIGDYAVGKGQDTTKYAMGSESVTSLELSGVVCRLFCGRAYWSANGRWELGNVGDF